ncbi:MAG: hypothetical protein HN509_00140 [Halobacteriovoraceae bacterium]|jgi:hypothetical protein|nr:hypothetical protein [Halobacteriovoraceae bacterium]MBT5095218.1 hypothetical protein [Halobacteriovoraceae bacterium]
MKPLNLFLILSLLFFFTFSCGKEPGKKPAQVTTENNASGVHVSCLCTMQYDPVCADGVTYSNTCMAQCENITFWTAGACP